MIGTLTLMEELEVKVRLGGNCRNPSFQICYLNVQCQGLIKLNSLQAWPLQNVLENHKKRSPVVAMLLHEEGNKKVLCSRY